MKTKKVISFLLVFALLMAMTPAVFAADVPTITVGNCSIESGATSASVTVDVAGFSSLAVSGLKLVFTLDSGLTISGATLSTEAASAGFEIDNAGFANGIVSVNCDTNHMLTGVTVSDGTLLTLNLTVDSNATGTLVVELSDDQSNYLNSSYTNIGNVAVVAGSITVGSTTPEVTAPYTATLSSTTTTVTNGETVSVTVTVGGTAETYNAAEIALSYPSDILSYTNISTTSDEMSVDAATAGKLYIVDKGSENATGMTYTLNFNTIKAGTANVTLDSASFGTRIASQTGNLTVATVANSPLSVTVNPKTFAVTFPADTIVTGSYLFVTEQTPTEGVNFVFTAANSNYTYSDVVVKVGESTDTAVEISGVTGDQTNGWTVPGESITGNLYVTATATPKSYAVTYSYVDKDGQTQSGSADNATYGTNYTYTMPEGVAATGTTDGFHYEVGTLTINGSASSAYNENLTTREVAITGTAITGPVVITLNQVTDSADSWAVSVEAQAEITASEYSVASSVKKGETIALTIFPQTGYTYTVTAKTTADGTTVDLTKNGNVYTTTNGVTENITFVITRSVDTSSFDVEIYLEGGMGESKDQNMYLVMIGTNLDEKHYTCNGKAMYWSEKYNANCYLVIASTEPSAESLTFTIEDGAATAVSYDMDVNESTDDTVDANDAQLAYDMYNKYYNVDTENVTIWKFLKADVNGDKKLDTMDAANIVNAVLTRMKSGT